MKKHYKVLGILFLVMSGLTLMAAAIVTFVFQMVLPHVHDQEGEVVLNILLAFLPTLLVFLSIPGIIAGIGLLKYKRWALIMAVILSVFNFFSFPLGTGLSIYSIYLLIKEDDLIRQDKINEEKEQWAKTAS